LSIFTELLYRTELILPAVCLPGSQFYPEDGYSMSPRTHTSFLNICDINLNGKIILKCVLSKKIYINV
jgi:hypothetical protein